MVATDWSSLVGSYVFYRSRQYRSGAMVKLIGLAGSSHAKVRHVHPITSELLNEYEVPLSELSVTHPNPFGAVSGIATRLSTTPIGMVFRVGEKVYSLYWDMHMQSDTCRGAWVLSEQGRCVVHISEQLKEMEDTVREMLGDNNPS